ncbi:MAG: aminoacyl-tRNA hydrolase [Alphaproteobacteria bacterium]
MSGLPFFNLFKRQHTGESMWMFVGLGNPGTEHACNRHNVGFMVMDVMREKSGAPDFRKKFQGLVAEGSIGGNRILFLKPQTYMNLSGESVAPAAKFYKIPPERIFVFHDEIDIAPGDVRVKQGGGNAGHNGLKSIQQHLGTPDFWRVRIGVGRPEHGDVSDYVLGNYSKDEVPQKDRLVEKLAAQAGLLLDDPKNYEKKILEG